VKESQESIHKKEGNRESGLSHISEVVTNRQIAKIEVTCQDCGEKYETLPLGMATKRRCPKCSEEKNRRMEEREEQASLLREQERILSLTRLAGMPPKWRETTFSSSSTEINRTALKICQEYAEGFNRKSQSLVLYSQVNGNGKTHLATCIANHILHELRLPVMFKKARDLMLEIRRTFSDRYTTEAEILDKVSYVDLLVLDDVGHDPASDWIFGTYWTVLDRRLEWELPVVITTNKPFESNDPKQELLCDRIGTGAASRLMGLCQGNIIELVGPDLR